MSDDPIETLLREGRVAEAAQRARGEGRLRRAAELATLAGRPSEGVNLALESGDWRLAFDLAIQSGHDNLIDALCQEIIRHPEAAERSEQVAAHARVARRTDLAARLLEAHHPFEAAKAYYELGEHRTAGMCFLRANENSRAIACFEQHLAADPRDIEIATYLADLRAVRGDADGAIRAIQSARIVAPADPALLRKLVSGLLRAGIDGAALVAARRASVVDPTIDPDPLSHASALPSPREGEQRYAGRYRVVREVGSGATGRVMEAVDELTNETVALKVLSVPDDRSAAFGRFMREAELARSIDAPTLVRLRDMDPEGPTIVYDWMPGGTLLDRIDGMSLSETRNVTMRLLSALETLHRNGVVHRDLKPSNVLFDPAGQARLGDLGAAHLGDLGTTVTGGLVGSLPYMAPEQITGEAVSASTDLYALGCLLFQMLTGRLPFPGPDFVAQHLGDPIPRVSEIRVELGTAYDAIIETLLLKDPLERPADVGIVRGMVQSLPWIEPDVARQHPSSVRPSTRPDAADQEGARLVPSIQTPGRWHDGKLGREIERRSIPRAFHEQLLSVAACARSDVQALYEIHDPDPNDPEFIVWLEPVDGEQLRLPDLAASMHASVELAFSTTGITVPLAQMILVRTSVGQIVYTARSFGEPV